MVRDHLLAADAARLCVSRLVRSRCAAHAESSTVGKGKAPDKAAKKGKIAGNTTGKDKGADATGEQGDAAGRDQNSSNDDGISAGGMAEALNATTKGGEDSARPSKKRRFMYVVLDSEDDGEDSEDGED